MAFGQDVKELQDSIKTHVICPNVDVRLYVSVHTVTLTLARFVVFRDSNTHFKLFYFMNLIVVCYVCFVSGVKYVT